MDSIAGPLRRQYERHIVTWDRQFEQRQEYKYKSEDIRLQPRQKQSGVDSFFADQETTLDPTYYAYTALHDYLDLAKEEDLEQYSIYFPDAQRLALINDRRDMTGWKDDEGNLHYARNWEDYETWPPSGEDEYFELLDAGQLFLKLKENVSISWA